MLPLRTADEEILQKVRAEIPGEYERDFADYLISCTRRKRERLAINRAFSSTWELYARVMNNLLVLGLRQDSTTIEMYAYGYWWKSNWRNSKGKFASPQDAQNLHVSPAALELPREQGLDMGDILLFKPEKFREFTPYQDEYYESRNCCRVPVAVLAATSLKHQGQAILLRNFAVRYLNSMVLEMRQ